MAENREELYNAVDDAIASLRQVIATYGLDTAGLGKSWICSVQNGFVSNYADEVEKIGPSSTILSFNRVYGGSGFSLDVKTLPKKLHITNLLLYNGTRNEIYNYFTMAVSDAFERLISLVGEYNLVNGAILRLSFGNKRRQVINKLGTPENYILFRVI